MKSMIALALLIPLTLTAAQKEITLDTHEKLKDLHKDLYVLVDTSAKIMPMGMISGTLPMHLEGGAVFSADIIVYSPDKKDYIGSMTIWNNKPLARGLRYKVRPEEVEFIESVHPNYLKHSYMQITCWPKELGPRSLHIDKSKITRYKIPLQNFIQ